MSFHDLSMKLRPAIAVMAVVSAALQAQDFVPPPDANVIVMTKPPYSLVSDDKSKAAHNAEQLRKAMNENAQLYSTNNHARGHLYFPEGTYYINSTCAIETDWDTETKLHKIALWGRNREKTIIRLTDNTNGFGDPQKPKVMIGFITSIGANYAMGNHVRHLTIDVGSGNPGAIALDFINNNSGSVRDVTIRSSDSKQRGVMGIDLRKRLGGIGLLKNVRIEGFDTGIAIQHCKVGYVFEHITLVGQKKVGIEVRDKYASIRGLITEGIQGASVSCANTMGLVVLLDSRLSGSGSAAIVNRGTLLARNVEVSGYTNSIEDETTGKTVSHKTIGEYVSHEVARFWKDEHCQEQTLGLPIAETPVVLWEQDPAKWIVVDCEKQNADSDVLQDAIDACTPASGKTSIWVKGLTCAIAKTVVVNGGHGGNVSRIYINCGVQHTGAVRYSGDPLLRIETGKHEAFILESGGGHTYECDGECCGVYIQNNSAGDVVIANAQWGGSRPFYRHGPNVGRLFLESVASEAVGKKLSVPALVLNGQRAWARAWNPEHQGRTLTLNNGGRLWVLGYKTEGGGTKYHTKNGGMTEVLGGEANMADGELLHLNEGGHVSMTTIERSYDRDDQPLFSEVRDGQKRHLRKDAFLTYGMSDQHKQCVFGATVALYAGYDCSKLPRGCNETPIAGRDAVPKLDGRSLSLCYGLDGRCTLVLRTGGRVRVGLYHVDGRLIARPLDGVLAAGSYRFGPAEASSRRAFSLGPRILRVEVDGAQYSAPIAIDMRN